MTKLTYRHIALTWVVVVLVWNATAAEQPPNDAEAVAYFENHIRPALVDNCYECHGGDPAKVKGGLNLTYRDGLLQGGSSGPSLTPGSPETSPFFEAIQYHNTELQMPPVGKLADDVVARFEHWIRTGAADPRDTPPSAAALSETMAWETVRDRRMAWWSFQPVQDVPPPTDVPAAWATNDIDAFIWKGINDDGLEPSPLADARTLVRRLYFVITGLPPTPAQAASFEAAAEQDWDSAVATTVDSLLASPAFGERWGRHWMDWMRYAESHGSEGDPAIPHAWRYRDYIIRALNDDVPYDALVREHLAGDLLATPRINPDTGVNESMLGIAQYRFVLHGYSPTDALDERVRFTDNQIDVVSKTFLALTVSCARCHNHKFDPVSQKDYYALFGIMAGGHPATVTVDAPDRQVLNKQSIAETKTALRAVMAEGWLRAIAQFPEIMQRAEGPWASALANATSNQDPLHPWQRLRGADDANFQRGWRELAAQWTESSQHLRNVESTPYPMRWNLGGDDARDWVHHGNGLDGTTAQAGSFDVSDSGEGIIRGIYPAGLYTHLTSTKHSGVLMSPRFPIENKLIYVRLAGDGNARHRYVVQDYPRNGQVYPTTGLSGGTWRWQRWDLTYWQGDEAHLEVSTANDQAVLADMGPKRSWFGITDAIVVGEGQPTPQDEMAEFVAPLFSLDGAPKNSAELATRYQASLRQCVEAWRDDAMNDDQARFLDHFVRRGLLPNSVAELPEAAELLDSYRRLESEIPFPTRAPGIVESAPFDQPLFARGDHKQPGERVERRFLESIDPTPYEGDDAGRLALAESILHEGDPLVARVIANRLWHHTFGRGIVGTTDNFGAMGELPTHPELLDHLAARFREEGWSLKRAIRRLVTSRTFQLSAVPQAVAREKDPGNLRWSHAMVRRLEAEAIRDAMLATSGRLDSAMTPQPVGGQDNRRSVYVRVVRNDLDPFLTTFDAPTPVSTKGRRDVTNVPAHALTLMNDPFVRSLAVSLAERAAKDTTPEDPGARIDQMVELVIGRRASDAERQQLVDYVEAAAQRPAGRELDQELDEELKAIEARIAAIESELDATLAKALIDNPELASQERQKQLEQIAPEQLAERTALRQRMAPLARLGAPPEPWVEIAQSLFSLKEFIYLR